MFKTPAPRQPSNLMRARASARPLLSLNDAPAHDLAHRFCRKRPHSWLAQQLKADVLAKEPHIGPELAPWFQLGQKLLD